MKPILETQRLLLRELNLNDAPFIVTLLNTPSWLEFIGDKNVKTIEEAEKYLTDGPLESYRKNGFGLSLVLLKDSMKPIGMCGLIKRETLDDIDIGFAFLPDYERQGYGYEIARATLDYAKYSLKIEKVVAITSPGNTASIRLLEKLGLQFEKTVVISEKDTVQLFSPGIKLNQLP